MEDILYKDLKTLALSMFRKNMIGIYHGSMSARIELNKFLINKKDAVFDNLEKKDFILLSGKKDYRWKLASIDAEIHYQIYTNVTDSKYVLYAHPTYTVSYSLLHNKIVPKDYFGHTHFGEIPVFDPGGFEDWYDRADIEISRYFVESKKNIMIIKGYGVYLHSRDIVDMVKTVAVLENSCRILLLSSLPNQQPENLKFV